MIRLDNVSKIFGTGVAGLSDINLLVDRGEFIFLVGHTGSGKTTLLRLLVRDMLPSSGTIIVSDFDVVKLPTNKIPHLRKKIGVVFQDLKLLMDRTIVENIALPIQVAGKDLQEAIKRADELLGMVGLGSHRDKFPVQLSGGELQRVAIARALALSPEILLADEPTGNLDPQTAQEIVDLLTKINEMGTTIIMATHNLEIVGKMNKRVVGLEKGKVVKDERKGHGKHDDKEKNETKGKHEQKSVKDESTLNAGEKENITATIDVAQEDTKVEEHNSDDKAMEHKKETKKLSDLLAKARATLHRKDDKKENSSLPLNGSPEKNMPFGFTKDMVAVVDEEKSSDTLSMAHAMDDKKVTADKKEEDK